MKVGLGLELSAFAHGLPVRVPLMGRDGVGTSGAAGTSPWQWPNPSHVKLAKHASDFAHEVPLGKSWQVSEMGLHWLHGPQLSYEHCPPASMNVAPPVGGRPPTGVREVVPPVGGRPPTGETKLVPPTGEFPPVVVVNVAPPVGTCPPLDAT